MPITGRRPADCFKEFHEHVRRIFELTLPPPAPVRLSWASIRDSRNAVIEFSKGDGVSTCLPVKTDFGKLYLSVYQALRVQQESKRWRLETVEYRYRLLDEDDPRADAMIRWEYLREPPRPFPRHHVQTRSKIVAPDEITVLPLDRLHTPSGWVTIEEVIRFLIHDLGVKPRDNAWPTVLGEGDRRFYEDFTSKRHWALRLLPGGRG